MTNDSTIESTDDEPDYDVVLDTLQKHHDKLMGVDKHVNEYTPLFGTWFILGGM
jgi:hypothetical protein